MNVTLPQDSEWFRALSRQDKFTRAVSFHVLHWIPNLKSVLENINRVMASHGRFLVCHDFKPKQSYVHVLPKLTSERKWKNVLDKVNTLYFLCDAACQNEALISVLRYLLITIKLYCLNSKIVGIQLSFDIQMYLMHLCL